MLKRAILALPLTIVLAFVGVAAFAATTHAATAAGVEPDSSILDVAKPVWEAFSGGHYAYAAALMVILMVALVKRYLGDKVAFLHSDAGGSLMALVAAVATAMAAGLAAPGATITLALLKTSLLVGVGAAGGYALLKNLVVEPILMPLAAKYTWMQPVLSVVMWMFDHGTDAAKA